MTRAVKGRPNRDVMLAAAEKLFAERGFGASSLRDLLAAMSCSTTAFYARFGSKDDVLEELVRGLIADVHDAALATLGRARTEEEGFRRGADALVGVILPRKSFVAVALSEGSCTEGTRQVLKESFDLLAALLAAQFELSGAEDPPARAWAAVGAVHMQVFRWAVLGDIPDEELAGRILAAAAPLMSVR